MSPNNIAFMWAISLIIFSLWKYIQIKTIQDQIKDIRAFKASYDNRLDAHHKHIQNLYDSSFKQIRFTNELENRLNRIQHKKLEKKTEQING